MDAVNWHMQAKNDDSNDAVDPADNTTWEQEAIVERIINDLEQLAAIDGGAAIANTLKYKCWADLDLQRLIPELAMLKSRYELSQRFYIIQGEGISAHEAYRFLLNRWMERKLQADSRLLRQQEAASQMVKMDTKDSGDKKKNNRSKKNTAK